jgi:cation:H+ antiporter
VISNLLYIAAGVALLTTGGELLIRGALGAANRLGVSPLLSGLLIVGFGTSAPELVVSVDAALAQRPDIAIGNVVGSNISNVLLILGVCALITPLAVKSASMRRLRPRCTSQKRTSCRRYPEEPGTLWAPSWGA